MGTVRHGTGSVSIEEACVIRTLGHFIIERLAPSHDSGI
jgi:hypothetical protein